MSSRSNKFLQITAYVMLTCIFVLVIGITRDCGRLNTVPVEGFSRGDTLDIALIYGPGSYYTYGDTLSGINYALAEAFERDNSIPIKIWPIGEPAEGMEKLESGAFDIVASLPLDNYVKKNYNVSESIFLDRLVLIQMADSLSGDIMVKSSLDLNGKEVHIVKGSSAIQRLNNLSNEIGGNIKIIEEPELSEELLTLQVALGKIPLAVVNERVAKKMSENYPLLKYDSTVSFTQFQVWLFNLGDTVVSKKFNEWYEKFHTTDEYREIVRRY